MNPPILKRNVAILLFDEIEGLDFAGPFEVFAVPGGVTPIAVGLLAVPMTLLARLISVTLPITAMSLRGPYRRGLVPVLTWSGLRGGISVAMVLSLSLIHISEPTRPH